MKRICVILAVILLGTFVFMPAYSEYEGKGYKSPEEVMEAYIRFWNSNDWEGMLSVYAVENYVDHFNPAESLKTLQSVNSMALTELQYTVSVPQLQQLEYYSRVGNIADEIRARYLVAHMEPDLFDKIHSRTVVLSEESDQIAFLQSLNGHTGKTSCTVSLVRFLSPDDLTEGLYTRNLNRTTKNDSRTQRERKKSLYGADDYIDCAALINVDGTEYVFMLCCGCWSGHWYAISGQGLLSAIIGIRSELNGLVPARDLLSGN